MIDFINRVSRKNNSNKIKVLFYFFNYCCLLILLANNCCLAGDYYNDHAVGWHWYDDPKLEEKNTVKKDHSDKNPNQVVADARAKITTALNQVIAEPTSANLKKYLTLQEQLANRAEQVANLWQQVLLENPQMNYSFTHPTNKLGLDVYHEEQSEKQQQAIRSFAKQTGLFFFYRSTCHYCQRFAPILKNFAEQNGITVIPISLDGISLPEFPGSKMNTGQAAKFHVSVTPSLFAVNPYTQKAYPVAYGLTSETELRDNIYKIMTHASGGQL